MKDARSGPHSDSPRDTLERLTTARAAQLLGISEGAVRKRAQRGKIPHERDADGRLWVWVDPQERHETYRDRPGASPGQSRDQSRDELVSEMRGRIDDLREQLEAERRAHAEARRIIAGLVERIPAIEAPSEAPESPERAAPTSTPTEDHGEAQEAVQRPWWRRVFGG